MVELTIAETSTIRDALNFLSETAQGIAFAVDASGKLTGILTDGDIRRALLKGSTLETVISGAMQRKFVSLSIDTPAGEITKYLSPSITHIPLLDDAGIPVDYASFARLHRISVSEPSLSGNEMAYVVEAVKTNWISSQGRFVKKFEEVFALYHDNTPALAVSNGTTALHLALLTLGIGPGDEVLVPDLTFAASANAVLHAGATPVLVDVDSITWTMDPKGLQAALTPKTRAIMPVHLYGHPCDMDPILEFAQRNHLLVVEDCAEALGALYKGKRLGTLGDAGCFSFFSNKLITTGEGGMVLYKKQSEWEHGKRLRDHGMDPYKRYWHTEIGYNYRLTNLQAAIGVAQMEQIDHFVNRKVAMAEMYRAALKPLEGIHFPESAPWATNVYWLFTILVDESVEVSRDDLMKGLLQNGIETRPLFYPLSDMPIYKPYARGRSFPVAKKISRSGLSLPSAVSLQDSEITRVCKELTKILTLKQLSKSAN